MPTAPIPDVPGSDTISRPVLTRMAYDLRAGRWERLASRAGSLGQASLAEAAADRDALRATSELILLAALRDQAA